MTAKDLKNALLQEAVQGKLVPQIASEGNARDLLEEIKNEKEKLIKEGKLKKEKPLPEITDEEIPFDIPENWCWCRLGDLGLYRKGPFGSSLIKSMFVPKSNDSIKVYEQKNAIQKDFSLGDYYISKDKFSTMQSFIVEPNDIIVSCAGTIGEVYKLPDEAPVGIINQALMRVKLFEDELSYFWILYFDYFLKHEASKQGSGTAIKNIPPFEILKNYPFPLPPLSEQKRILDTLKKAIPLIEEYGKKEAELTALNADIAKTLKNAILQEAVQGKLAPQIASEGNAKDLLEEIKKEKAKLIKEGKLKKDTTKAGASGRALPEITEDEIPFDIPENWCWCRLGKISINRDSDRIPLSVSQREHLNKIYDYYGASGVIDKVDKFLFDKPLLLIGEDGANLLTRSTPIAFIASGKYWVNNHAHVLDFDERYFFMKYIMWYINSISLAKYVTGTAQPKMNQEKMNSIPVPIPPLAEQKRIVEAVEKILSWCNKIEIKTIK